LILINGDWGLGIGDWGLGPIANPQSPIPKNVISFEILFYIKKNYIINIMIFNIISL